MSTVSTKIDPSIAGKEMFTTAEAAEALGLGRATVQHYCQGDAPRIKATKLGRDWLIPKAEIDRYKRERRDVGRPPSES